MSVPSKPGVQGPSSTKRLGGAAAPTFTPLEPGTVLGEFVIESMITHGGMGTVYGAVHPLIGKKAAIKVMSDTLSRDRASVAKFIQEARSVNQIGHPNIVDIFSFGRLPDGRSWLAMERLEGESLADRMDAGPIPAEECYEILIQICDALEAAHEKRIVHLDLKPENVFLVAVRGGRTTVKLLDFGIAKLLSRDPTPAPVPSTRRFHGTPEYASPEQAQGLETIAEPSDAYSLGVMTYEMFVGQRPFSADGVISLLLKQVRERPQRPSSIMPSVPAGLERLVLELLEKKPERRPTIAQARERLESLRRAGAVSTQSMEPLSLPVSITPTRAWRAAVVLLVAGAVAAAAVSRGRASASGTRVVTPALTSAASLAIRQTRTSEPSSGAAVRPSTRMLTARLKRARLGNGVKSRAGAAAVISNLDERHR